MNGTFADPFSRKLQLIYAGKILRDDVAQLASFVDQDLMSVVLHMVLKPGARSMPPATDTNLPPHTQNEFSNPVTQQSDVGNVTEVHQSEAPSVSVQVPSANGVQKESAPHEGSTSRQEGCPGPQLENSETAEAVPPGSAPSLATYQVAYQAAYQAALQAILAHGGDGNSPSALHPSTPVPSVHPSFTLLPTIIPIPQPMLPPGMFDPAGRPDAADASSSFPGHFQPQAPQIQPIFVPVMPIPVAAVGPQFNLAGPQFRMELRHRGDGMALSDEIARELRARGVRLHPRMGEDDVRRMQQPGVVPHQMAANQGVNAVRRPQVRQFQWRIQINVRALLQLIVLMVVVYQHCPPRRFVALLALGVALWLSTTPRVRELLRQLAGIGGPRVAGGVNAGAVPPANPMPVAAEAQRANDAGRDGPVVDVAQLPHQPLQGANQPVIHAPRRGILHDVRAFITAFVTSLLPAVEHNPVGAAAAGAVRDVFGGE